MSEIQEVSGRSARSSCRPEYTKVKAQVSKNARFPSRLLECTRQVTPLPFGLAKLSPSCLQRERYFSRCGAKRERKRQNAFRYLPSARGRCAAKRSLPPTLLARSSAQEDAISRRGRLLSGTPRLNLVDGHPGSWLLCSSSITWSTVGTPDKFPRPSQGVRDDISSEARWSRPKVLLPHFKTPPLMISIVVLGNARSTRSPQETCIPWVATEPPRLPCASLYAQDTCRRKCCPRSR